MTIFKSQTSNINSTDNTEPTDAAVKDKRVNYIAGKVLTEVEVDQSGKIKDPGADTVLAFSNGLSRAIRMPASAKR